MAGLRHVLDGVGDVFVDDDDAQADAYGGADEDVDAIRYSARSLGEIQRLETSALDHSGARLRKNMERYYHLHKLESYAYERYHVYEYRKTPEKNVPDNQFYNCPFWRNVPASRV